MYGWIVIQQTVGGNIESCTGFDGFDSRNEAIGHATLLGKVYPDHVITFHEVKGKVESLERATRTLLYKD